MVSGRMYTALALTAECVEFLDGRTMKAINQGGLTGKTYKEVDSLFFKFQG